VDSAWPIERRPRPARAALRPLLGGTPPDGYVLFVATPGGFALVERDGPPPGPDQLLHLDDGAYCVVSIRRSPLPRDPRPCFVVERAS
jgi:hypothetical protein